ncbi:MAG: hypothetical protein ACXW4B_09730 [Micavibrio sp.]
MTTVKTICDRQGERGNVLFLILIAVALFAALSYAVTQSTRSGSGDASGETNLINSAQLAQYPAGVRTAVVRMIIGGISADQLLFDAPANYGSMSPSELVFDVFHPTGGGAVYQDPPNDLMVAGSPGVWLYSSAYQIDGIGLTDPGGTTGNDFIAFLPGISQNVCRKLNEEVGISSGNPDGIPNDAGITPAPTAAEAMVLATPGIGNNAAAPVGTIAGSFVGQPFGCFRIGATPPTSYSGTSAYVYYHVLVER